MRGIIARCAAAAALGGSAGYLAAGAGEAPQIVALTARKFAFSAVEIRVRAGRPVTFVLDSTDFVHGFSVPELGVRADLVPGQRVELAITPARPGRYIYLCDNFCGESHDAMSGVLIVGE